MTTVDRSGLQNVKWWDEHNLKAYRLLLDDTDKPMHRMERREGRKEGDGEERQGKEVSKEGWRERRG